MTVLHMVLFTYMHTLTTPLQLCVHKTINLQIFFAHLRILTPFILMAVIPYFLQKDLIFGTSFLSSGMMDLGTIHHW